MTGLVRWLDDLGPADVTIVGGKVAQLAGLKAAGIPVPNGFAVTAVAYLETVERGGMSAALRRLALSVKDDPTRAAEVARECAALVVGCTVPAAVEDAVTSAYAKLTLLRRDPLPLVAVRSSALREDSADASSAGQYDSFLGISGASSVLESVQRCWASLFNERALVYRAKYGIDVESSPMAVGVIELVDARASGVAFSLHPVTGNADRLVVESTFGWGEALVQGRVNPDHFEVDRADLRVLQYRVGLKTWVSTWSGSGTGITEIAMPEVLVSEPSLTEAEVRRICGVLLNVERLMAEPVDLEWVWPRSGEGPVVVQARSVTSHREPAQPSSRPTFDPMANALRHTFQQKSG